MTYTALRQRRKSRSANHASRKNAILVCFCERIYTVKC